MISPVSLHYMTVVMGYNTRGVNTPHTEASAPVTIHDIVPSKCVQTHKKLPYWNSILSLYVMTLILSAQGHIRGFHYNCRGFRYIATGSTRFVVCSMPQNDSAATIQQSDSTFLLCLAVHHKCCGFSSLFTHSAFFSFRDHSLHFVLHL